MRVQIQARIAADMARALDIAKCQYWIRTPDGTVICSEGIVGRDSTEPEPPKERKRRGVAKAIYGDRYENMELSQIVTMQAAEYKGTFTAQEMRHKIVSTMIRLYGAQAQYTVIGPDDSIETMRMR